jgi:hypothetical protein
MAFSPADRPPALIRQAPDCLTFFFCNMEGPFDLAVAYIGLVDLGVEGGDLHGATLAQPEVGPGHGVHGEREPGVIQAGPLAPEELRPVEYLAAEKVVGAPQVRAGFDDAGMVIPRLVLMKDVEGTADGVVPEQVPQAVLYLSHPLNLRKELRLRRGNPLPG